MHVCLLLTWYQLTRCSQYLPTNTYHSSEQVVYDADQVTEASHMMHQLRHHPIVASYTETMLQPASQKVVEETDMLQQQAEHDQAALHLILNEATVAHG